MNRNDLLNSVAKDAEEFVQTRVDDEIEHAAINFFSGKPRVILEGDLFRAGEVF